MSDSVATYITTTLQNFDTLVHDGLRDGDLLNKVLVEYAAIVIL